MRRRSRADPHDHPPLVRVLRRRDFLAAVSAVAGVSAAGCQVTSSRWRVLTDAEGEILAALCDVLIPADDYPSASQAGAVEFFDRRLLRGGVRELPLVRGGLAALDATSRASGPAFPALPPAAREALVASVEQGEVPGAIWNETDARAFFRHVLARTMQSYYADPRHGGNRDRASWRMVGLPDPPVRGRHKDG